MKNFTLFYRCVILFCLLFFTTLKTYGQLNYANSQRTGAAGLLCLNCTVTNPANAADGNLQSFSVLNVTVGLAAQTYQELIFPSATKVAAGTMVTIKLGTGNNLVDLTALGGISVQAYNGGTAIDQAVTASTLVSALSNNNQYDVSIKPSQVYDRVRVTLNGGLLGALSSIYLYEAYYNPPAPFTCNAAVDELHGISSALLGLGVDVGGVTNPLQAIDGNINTASTLNAGVGLLGAYAQQTIIYQTPSVVGDSIRLTVALPQAIVDAGVLANISVSTFNGSTDNNDSQTLSGGLLNIRLLDLSNNIRKVAITIAPTKIFDRVQLRLGGGVASLLSTLNLYEAQKLIPRPVVKYNNVITTNAQICSGSAATLTAVAMPNTTFNWYTTPTGGTAVTGPSFTTPALTTTTTYYVSAMRAGCTDESERAPVTITVNPIPVAPVVTNNTVSVCPGQPATFTAQAVTGITVNWYTAATGGTLAGTGNTFTTGALTQTTNYYAEAVSGGTCTSPARTMVTANISALPATPALAAANVTICTGDVAVLSIATPVTGEVYNWYSTQTGGTPLLTGINFTTPALTATTSYYAEAVNATGCSSSQRVLATVTVQSKPADPILAANNLTISAGQTATINVSNAQTGIVYNWYTSATASTSIFSGATYQTPALYTNTTYYVSAVNTTGCVSVNRTAITINVTINNNSPCTFANQQTTNINGVCVLCIITNPALAVDADTTTASTISVPIGIAGGYAEQQVVFQQPGLAGDTIKIGLQSPVNLANVGLLSSIQVTLYNGTTQVSQYTLDNALIKLSLLGGGNKYAVYIPATGNYDRATIRLTSGVATLLTSLQIYYAIQQYPRPVFAANPEICRGNSTQLSITSPTNGTFSWYSAPTGGSPVNTGATFNTPAITANTTYYVDNSRNGCSGSVRYPITILVNDAPVKPVVDPTSATINSGQTATFTANVPNGVTVKWYSAANGGTALATGNTFTSPALTVNTDYYAESSIGSCVSTDRTPVTVTVNPIVIPDVAVNPPTQAVGAGTVATLTATSTTPGVTFNWYTAPAGGTSIFTGQTFNTPPVFNNTTYYAEAVVTATGAVSAARAAGVVTINAVASSPVACDAAIDQTSSNSGLLCVGCVVNNATGSVDNDRNTFSQLNVLVGLLNAYQQQTLRFASTGRAGDSVIVELGIPGTLASVGVLSQISLATYNGNTYNNDRFNVNGSLISINLLSGTSRFRVAFKAQSDFDRVEIRLNSTVAGVLSSLNIYDAAEEVAAPVVTVANVGVCQGAQATLTATVPDYETVKWYTAASGGAAVFTGAVFNTPALTASTIYYAEASRTADGCTQAVRTPVNVTVTPVPAAPVVNASTVTVCSGQPATFTAQAVTGVTFNWYAQATGGTAVFTGNPFTTPNLTANTTYYAEAAGAAQCGSSTRTAVNANVASTPVVPTVSQASVQTCSGSSAVLTATSTDPGVTFNWYTAATGGTPVFTGAQFATPALNVNTSYFVEAASGTCTSPARAEADVVVNPSPAAPTIVVTPANAQITSGQTATIAASSTTPGVVFNWYTTATGGSPIFTGATYTTPLLSSNATYYVESSLTATGCISSQRTLVTITVNPIFSTTCDFASSQTFDVNNGLGCIGCTVNTPAFAVDADTTNFSQLSLPLALVSSYVSQSLIFGDTGGIGDTVSVRLSIPASLLTAGILNQIQIASYNGTTYNGDRISLSNSTINLRILSGGQTALVRFAPGAAFDRVEIRLTGSIAAVLSSVNIYYASKQVEAPALTATTVNICAGNTATFTVANARAGVTYKWYTDPAGGSQVGSGATFTTGNLLATTTYYAESSRTVSGCINPNRVAATANVTPSPVNPTFDHNNLQVCAGNSVTFTVTNTNGATINWYDASTGGNLLFTGPTFTATPVTDANYYAEATNGTCTSPARTLATVHVNPIPAMPGVQSANVQVCAGSPATLQILNPEAGVTYNWYATATGGAVAGSGTSFTTPPVTQNISYYAEAANTTTGCINNGGRTQVAITINNQATAPVLSAATTQVCNGGSASISVVNPVAGLIYNWYTAAAGGTPVFAGSTYTINNITANASYFVEATTGAGCTATTRTETDIAVLAVPTPPQIQVPAGGLNVCTGSSAIISISNPQANQVYRWYGAATGGTLLFTGTQFATPALTATTTYYIEASTAGNCNASIRTPVTININALPNNPVLAANNIAVCNGSSATLSISSPQTGVTYNWYDSPAMTNLLFSGSTYITGPITATTDFYAAAANASGCSNGNLAQVQVTVQSAPGAPLIANGTTVQSCNNAQATLSIANPQIGFTYNWYSTATGGNSLFTGTDFVTPVLTANATFYAETVNSTGCTSPTRTAVSVTLSPSPDAPQVSGAGTTICTGNAAALTASSTDPTAVIKWYANASGGTALATGNNFTTPVLTTNTTYYAETVNSNGCASATRTAVNVTISTSPGAPQVSNAGTSICPGTAATLTASSTDPTATVKWYASASGGTALAVGNSFTTPVLTANTTYYAGVNNAGGCSSATRTAVTVQILQPLAAPVVSVSLTSATSVTFTWSAVTGATGYQVSTNNGVTFTDPTSGSTGLSDVVGNLKPGQPATIIVRTIGASSCQLGSNSLNVTGLSANPIGNTIFVPNAFTPNGDGKNDMMYVYGTAIKSLTFYVYDQWGEMLFKGNDQAAGWDGSYKGTKEPIGVYVYYLDAVMNDGTKVNKKGTITLIR